MSSSIKPLFTASAAATGGRNGHSEASDHSVAVNLSVPKEMGGPGKPGTTTPEHLFAAGYAACFGGAMDFVGSQHKIDASKAHNQGMATCKGCGEDVDALVSVKVEGKAKKLCEDCADRAREAAEIAEASESVVQGMMGFKGRR